MGRGPVSSVGHDRPPHAGIKPKADPKTLHSGLSDFTANVSSTASWVRWWDMDLARGLDNLAKRQRDSMEAGLAHRALATMRPLAAFSAFDRTEDRVKELFVTTTNRVIGRVNLLVDSAEALLQGFQDIQDVLDHIKATAITEIGDLPTQSVLGALWVFLSLPDDREYAGMSHETLLRDLMQFYTTASGLMRDVIMALLRARAELEELDIEQVNPNICSRTAPSTSWRTRFEARQRDWAPAGRGSKQFDKAGGGVVCQSSRASVTGTPWMVTTEGNPGTRERHAQAA